MTWTPKDAAERDAVMALCTRSINTWIGQTGMPDTTEIAERIVPPVPVTLREYKGVTYRDKQWWDADGGDYDSAATCIWANDNNTTRKQITLTDDDHAALLDLKANPTVTPPTCERVGPVADAWLNVYADGETHAHLTKADADHYALPRVTRECVPLYRHPATPADAIALLVREGWVNEVRASSPDKNLFRAQYKRHGDTNVRVLIAPMPEVK